MTDKPTQAQTYERITLRLPSDVHAKLTEFASEQGNSMNAEIIRRVRESFEPQGFLDSDREMLEAILARVTTSPE